MRRQMDARGDRVIRRGLRSLAATAVTRKQKLVLQWQASCIRNPRLTFREQLRELLATQRLLRDIETGGIRRTGSDYSTGSSAHLH